MTKAIVVWNEIPTSNLEAAIPFYEKVFGYKLVIDEMPGGRQAIMMGDETSVGASLYVGQSAEGKGPALHLAIDGKVEDACTRVTGAGGKVVSEIITIPQGRFAYALDLDGNRLGLFEAA